MRAWGMSRLRVGLVLTTLLGLSLLAACQRERPAPEAQVRMLIQEAVTAAEQKRLGVLRDFISDHYRDDQGQDKRAVENLLRLQFLRNESLHLFARIPSVTVTVPDRAQAVVLVAMAGVPIASVQELAALRADLHRFEIDFVLEKKQWRVQRAVWRRAEASDFFSPELE